MTTAYVLIALLALAAVAVMLFLALRRPARSLPEGRLSPLAGLAFALIVAGIIFGQDRIVGYGLLAAGLILAVVDIVFHLRRRNG